MLNARLCLLCSGATLILFGCSTNLYRSGEYLGFSYNKIARLPPDIAIVRTEGNSESFNCNGELLLTPEVATNWSEYDLAKQDGSIVYERVSEGQLHFISAVPIYLHSEEPHSDKITTSIEYYLDRLKVAYPRK